MPHRNPHSCAFVSCRSEAQTGLESCGQEPLMGHVLRVLLQAPASWLRLLPPVRAGASEEMALPRSFLPFCRLPTARPLRSASSPSTTTCPRPTLVSPLPRSAATHGFWFSILSQAAVEVRPHHSRISSCECDSPTL